MGVRLRSIVTLALGMLVLCPGAVFGSTIFVPDQFGSIQEAIDSSVNGDIVIVRDGTYEGPINFKGKKITLRSENGPESCIIDGDYRTRGIIFDRKETSESIVDGFKFLNCYASWDGAGIYCGTNSSPTIINCVFSGNIADRGFGGGIYCAKASSPTITNCTFIDNRAYEEGGGISSDINSSPTVKSCSFTSNKAYAGGAMSIYRSRAVVDNSTFTANKADFGGAIATLDRANPAIINSTFRENLAFFLGGGLFSSDSSPVVTNCTFYLNKADYGGGIFSELIRSPDVTNCILWENVGGEIDRTFWNRPDVTYSNVRGGYHGEGNIDANPRFADSELRLNPDSPCIDRGVNVAAEDLYRQSLGRDKDGSLRIQDGKGDAIARVDMGAYESAEVPSVSDLSTVFIEALSPAVPEQSGQVALVRISRVDGDQTMPLVVLYAVGGTAKSGRDFKRIRGDVQIPAGAASVDIPISIIHDRRREGEETIILILKVGNGKRYMITPANTATVTIEDND